MSEVPTDRLISRFLELARSVHFFQTALDGTIERCNTAAADSLGLPLVTVVGRSIFECLTHPDARLLERELRTPGHRTDSVRLNFCDARQLPYTLECWLDVDVSGATLIAEPPLKHDQQLQRQLMEVNQDLAILSRERVKLINGERRARLEAEAANREKDDAIATIAHELRQPLSSLRLSLEIVKTPSASPQRDRAFAIMDRQMAFLTRLVDDLLDVARLRQHKLELRRAVIDLGEWVREVAEVMTPKMTESAIGFAYVVPDSPVWAQADSLRVTQALSNILENAIKFTPRLGTISVTLSREGPMAVISVRDTGRGIAPEVLPRIFTLFEQQVRGERGGLGIGLAIAHAIVAMHGGNVEAHSAGLGQGAEIVVRLPLAGERTLAPQFRSV